MNFKKIDRHKLSSYEREKKYLIDYEAIDEEEKSDYQEDQFYHSFFIKSIINKKVIDKTINTEIKTKNGINKVLKEIKEEFYDFLIDYIDDKQDIFYLKELCNITIDKNKDTGIYNLIKTYYKKSKFNINTLIFKVYINEIYIEFSSEEVTKCGGLDNYYKIQKIKQKIEEF